MSAVAQAFALAQAGRAGEAVALLGAEGAAGDGSALFALALWRIEGRWVPRDLTRACAELKLASGLGERLAARALSALLATGVSGERNWSAALHLLEEWQDRDEDALRQLDIISAMRLDSEGNPLQTPKPEVLSRDPYVARFPGFFVAEECDHLRRLTEPRFKPALIFHETQQRFVADPLRTSEAASFPFVSEGPAVHALNRRMAAASGTDVRQGETLQVLRYAPGQEYRPHLDAIPALANQRALTFLVYLNDGYQGGETDFPELGLRIRGEAGMGLLFANALADGRPDPRMRHAGLPVRHGSKLVASRWIRARLPDHPDGFGRHEAERQ
jgi:prolyl 4-hydroxylase